MRTYVVRVGSWEQALRDFAARQQAAAAAAAQQQQQQQQLFKQQQQLANGGPGVSEASSGRAGGGAGSLQPLPPIRVTALGGGSRSAGQLTLPQSPVTSDGANTGRFVHLLSTVTEETSLPPSPPMAVAAAGLTVTAPMALQLQLPSGTDHPPGAGGGGAAAYAFMRQSSSSTTGIRSPLSRPELSGSRLLPRSTFGSEAYYYDDSSEEGAPSSLNGMITASGMLRSCSSSLSGLMIAPSTTTGPGAGNGRRPQQVNERVGGATAGSAGAVSVGELTRISSGGGSNGGGGAAAEAAARRSCAAAADAAHEMPHGNGLMSAKTGAGAQAKYIEQLFGGAHMLNLGSGGQGAHQPLPSTIDYLEQRIASLGTQLAMELAKGKQLQASAG